MSNVAVVGLAWGDEGKGSIVDFLARQERTQRPIVVRFNGGPQAAHHVVEAGGREHCFAQFGSGTLAEADTFLSRFMLISLGALIREAETLEAIGVRSPLCNLYLDRDAILITPFQVEMNQLRELVRGDQQHGSCGRGVGEAVEDDITDPSLTIRIRDLEDPSALLTQLQRQREYKIEQIKSLNVSLCESVVHRLQKIFDLNATLRCVNELSEIYRLLQKRGITIIDREWLRRSPAPVIFEGAQGVLLDQDFGFHPYTTWSHTTFLNAELLTEEAGLEPLQRLGVLRSSMTRHGAGPFPTESEWASSAHEHNGSNTFQGHFRRGVFDAVLARYAIECCGRVDGLALTHLDEVRDPWTICNRYRWDSRMLFSRIPPPQNIGDQERLTVLLTQVEPVYESIPPGFVPWVEEHVGVKTCITSFGPTTVSKRWIA